MRAREACEMLAAVRVQMPPRRAVELREIHHALEPIAAQRWVASADEEAVERLRAAFERVRALVEAGAGPELVRCAKDRFFRVLYRSTGSAVLDALRSIEPAVRVVRAASIATPGRPRSLLAELEAILGAATARDAEALVAACARHIDSEFSMAPPST